MEILAEDLAANGFDLQRLIHLIAASEVFQLASRSTEVDGEVSDEQKQHWAAFPMTRLRPEQMAGSISQSASLASIDADSHIIRKLASIGERTNFVRRYGDLGEDEFGESAGTIPQRLLMMNGQVVRERIGKNPVMNASTRIGILSPDAETAVESAFPRHADSAPPETRNCPTSPRPSKAPEGTPRTAAMEDLYWSLLNSTEFSWNHWNSGSSEDRELRTEEEYQQGTKNAMPLPNTSCGTADHWSRRTLLKSAGLSGPGLAYASGGKFSRSTPNRRVPASRAAPVR